MAVEFALSGEAYVPSVSPRFDFGAGAWDGPFVRPPSVVTSAHVRWAAPYPSSAHPCAAGWAATEPRERALAGAWQRAERRDRCQALPWDALTPTDRQGGDGWSSALAADGTPAGAPWCDLPAKDCGLRSGWDRSIRPRDLRLRLIYNPMPARKDHAVRSPSRRSDEFGPRRDAAAILKASLYVPGAGPVAFNFGGRLYFPPTTPQVFFDFRYTAPSPRIQPVDSGAVGVRWQGARRPGLQVRMPWGKARVLDGRITGIEYPDYSGPVKPLPEPPPDPQLQDTYMIANTVTVVVLPERTPLEAKNIRVALDADSYSWSFSADIFTRAALDLVKPDEDGCKEIELDINGWTWVLMVERYSRQQAFAREAYSISGATRSQLLAAPYAPARTGLNGAPITARQAAEAELLYTGFTLHWDAETAGPPDWTFPAGALSYQGQTAMQVIARIAETVGAVVRPARDADRLDVVPRYPVPPWQWGTPEAPIAHIVPAAIYTQLGGEWTPQPSWNACYVSGTAHGVSMLVRRAGSAGDNPAPDVFDDWLTDQPANQARGIHELSKGGNIEIVSLTLPLFPVADDKGVGLLLPATLLQVPEETGETWVGLCLSVEIVAAGAGASRVQQLVKIERHH